MRFSKPSLPSRAAFIAAFELKESILLNDVVMASLRSYYTIHNDIVKVTESTPKGLSTISY